MLGPENGTGFEMGKATPINGRDNPVIQIHILCSGAHYGSIPVAFSFSGYRLYLSIKFLAMEVPRFGDSATNIMMPDRDHFRKLIVSILSPEAVSRETFKLSCSLSHNTDNQTRSRELFDCQR